MKNKIKHRLFFYFAASLIIFSLIIALVFTSLFSRYNMNIHKEELKNRSITIANSLSSLSNQRSNGSMHGGMGMGMGHMSYNSYLRFIDDIAMTDVWIFDPNLDLIVRGHGQGGLEYQSLPDHAEEVILSAMDGNTSFSENFSSLIGTPSVTVATPIVSESGVISGAVLLHAEISDISSASVTGLKLLGISMTIAVLISFIIAGILSSRFTKPLENMKQTAMDISSGNFEATTNIRQNDEIGELAHAMDMMAARLNEASKESAKLDQLRKDFIANISHELLTPVTVIRGSLEALHDGIVTEESMVDEYHNQMLSESLHLERLVRDLLDLSKLQNPDFKMYMQEMDISEAVRDAVSSVRRIARNRNIEIQMIGDENSLNFYGDYGRIRQMFMIVLHNAVKFSPDQAVVYVDIKHHLQDTSVTIRDEGCGIPPQDIEHIFDRFYKQRSEENKQGSGLGLSIAKQIADRHQIDINIVSVENKGTSVTFKMKYSEN